MIRFGKAKNYAKVTLDDHLKHLVWTSAHGGRHDEESEKPIVSTQEVTREIVENTLIVPVVTIKVEGADVYGTAWYLHRDGQIFAIALWQEGRWRTLRDATALPVPLVFVSVPRILGRDGVRFLCTDPRNENAQRIA